MIDEFVEFHGEMSSGCVLLTTERLVGHFLTCLAISKPSVFMERDSNRMALIFVCEINVDVVVFFAYGSGDGRVSVDDVSDSFP
jgi:hypothetical protein